MGKTALKQRPSGNQATVLPVLNPCKGSLFLQNIGEITRNRKLSLEQIAFESGLDKTLLSRMFNGEQKPSRFILQRLAGTPCMDISYKKLVTWCLLDDSLSYAEKTTYCF